MSANRLSESKEELRGRPTPLSVEDKRLSETRGGARSASSPGSTMWELLPLCSIVVAAGCGTVVVVAVASAAAAV